MYPSPMQPKNIVADIISPSDNAPTSTDQIDSTCNQVSQTLDDQNPPSPAAKRLLEFCENNE